MWSGCTRMTQYGDLDEAATACQFDCGRTLFIEETPLRGRNEQCGSFPLSKGFNACSSKTTMLIFWGSSTD